MLNHADNLQPLDASQVRVSVTELTEALASLDVRHVRKEYEQAETLTIAEALHLYHVNATAEELETEVKRVKEIDAVQAIKSRHTNRLRFVLKLEIVSALLCVALLAGFRLTFFDSNWQQAHQAEDFQRHLQASIGENPQYNICVVPITRLVSVGSDFVPAAFGEWVGHPAYPINLIPDGYNIHHFDSIDNEGHDNIFSNSPFVHSVTNYIEFLKVEKPFSPDNVSVFYDGSQYWRGWVRKQDVPNVLEGHSFTLYPALVALPQYQIRDIVPLTVSIPSIRAVPGQWRQAYPEGYSMIVFPEGRRLTLDKHAWEQYTADPGR